MNPEGLRHLFQDAGVELARRSLSRFIRDGWHQIEPATPLVHGWYVDAIAEHLEALTKGDIRKLLINVPPRHSKSSLVSVLWLPWVWLTKPATRWLFSSYALSLSLRDSVRTRRLIESPWYQSLVGGEFGIVGDQNTKAEFANEHTGYRIATSTDAGTTGKGGEFLVFDDPHNVNEAESELVRAGVLTWYDQVWSTRANDPRTVKECGIMQRVHEKDLAGHVLEHGGWTHLKLPAEFTGIKCSTSIGWSDPRVVSGELLDPVRFPREELDKLKVKLGPYGTSGQLQQEPSPAEGAIFKRAWIRHYERHEDFLVCDAEVRFRPQDCVRFATVDPAISQKDEADWFIMAAWAVFPAVRGVYVALLDLLRHAADFTFSRMIRGCRAAILRRPIAGPSGLRRPCSQFRNVWTLMPIACANCDCERPTKRRRAATSSPDSIWPIMSRLRTRPGIARANCCSVSSGIFVIAACLRHTNDTFRPRALLQSAR